MFSLADGAFMTGLSWRVIRRETADNW